MDNDISEIVNLFLLEMTSMDAPTVNRHSIFKKGRFIYYSSPLNLV